MFLIREKYHRTSDDMFAVNTNEHNGINYNNAGKTPAGQLMTYISSNIIKNGIKNSMLQKEKFVPLPQLESLIYGGYKEADAKLSTLWPQMINNGKNFRREVCNYAIKKQVNR